MHETNDTCSTYVSVQHATEAKSLDFILFGQNMLTSAVFTMVANFFGHNMLVSAVFTLAVVFQEAADEVLGPLEPKWLLIC